jgi:uracil-DNA glycosylase
VQRYGKDGAIDWDLNVDPEAIVEPSKTGQPADPKKSAEAKDSASTKENESLAKDVKETKGQSGNEDDPEADIDSDEEAALREAGL